MGLATATALQAEGNSLVAAARTAGPLEEMGIPVQPFDALQPAPIRVNVIAPSLTDTPLAGNLLSTEAKQEAAAKRHPLHRTGDPADVARLACFLLSDTSRFITGQVLRPDGGLSSVRTF